MARRTSRASWRKADPHLRMLSWIEGLPTQMRRAASVWPAAAAPAPVDRGVVIAAMGGSAMAAQVALAVARPRVPAFVLRTDALPSWVDERWLCIACSYSGNTRETLACYDQACRRGCEVCSVSSGGVLAEKSASRGALHRSLEPGQPPRTAVGQAVVGLLWLLWVFGVADDRRDDIHATAATMEVLWKQGIGGPTPWESQPWRIAHEVRDGFAIVVGAGLTVPAALRWSQQLNENAKVPCFALEVPEMLHNHVEGLEAAARFGAVLVLLGDGGLSLRESASLDYLGSLYAGFGGRVCSVTSCGVSELERIFSLMYVGDQVSYAASLLRGMDPTPVERIGHAKEVLARTPS